MGRRSVTPKKQSFFTESKERNENISHFPNPFNPAVTIVYEVKDDVLVSIIIYDMGGRMIVELVNEEASAGRYSFVWDGKDTNGQQVSSGMYFYKMIALPLQGGEAFIQTNKMLLLK